ncbi:MAG TPA: hypothetical protein VF115_13340 [Acidimicrobiia bacterium]
MDTYVIVLRLLHVTGGALWAGTALASVFFIQPSARAVGEPGEEFMRHLMGKTRLPAFMGASAVATVVSGVLLYWHDFGAIVPFNRPMLGYAIGAVAAITAWLVGLTVMLPSGRRMEELGGRASRGEDVGAAIAVTTARMSRYDRTASWLMILAVALMATARYL